jgi:type I restriction enzyme M protein
VPAAGDAHARNFWVQMKKSLGNKRHRIGDPEPDAELRDTENVPLKERIEAYFKREVLPHVPDAWIDESKTKVGYEIPLNRHFYRDEPPRPLQEIQADIRKLEGEIMEMLAEVAR